MFLMRNKKIIYEYSSIPHLIWNSGFCDFLFASMDRGLSKTEINSKMEEIASLFNMRCKVRFSSADNCVWYVQNKLMHHSKALHMPNYFGISGLIRSYKNNKTTLRCSSTQRQTDG